MTPLHWAAYNNDVGVLKLLLQSGAKNSVNKSGRAPIDLAGFCKNKEAVKVFVDDCESKIMGTLSGAQIL
jgi:ankyrin repeat protein